jgi:hypothetical protein
VFPIRYLLATAADVRRVDELPIQEALGLTIHIFFLQTAMAIRVIDLANACCPSAMIHDDISFSPRGRSHCRIQMWFERIDKKQTPIVRLLPLVGEIIDGPLKEADAMLQAVGAFGAEGDGPRFRLTVSTVQNTRW